MHINYDFIAACEYKKVAEANLLKGRCDMNGNRYKDAITAFQKSLDLYQRMKMIDEACEARIQLALALLASGNFTDSAYHLRKLLDYANDNDQTTYMARAYRYLGEYYLNHGSPHYSTPILLLAMRMFHRLNDIFNREQLKNLAAISQGQEALPYYIKLIVTADGSPNKLQKLLSWKDIREPFWPKTLTGSSDSLKDRLIKDGLGAGISEDDLVSVKDHEKLSPQDKEFNETTNRLRIPRGDAISMHGDDKPVEIIRDEDAPTEITGKKNNPDDLSLFDEVEYDYSYISERISDGDTYSRKFATEQAMKLVSQLAKDSGEEPTTKENEAIDNRKYSTQSSQQMDKESDNKSVASK